VSSFVSRSVVAFVVAATASWMVLAPASAQQQFTTSAPHAVLMDADTHTILFEKGADDPVVPASTTKVMTAELVFREIAEGRLKLDDEFVVSENAWRVGGAMARGSTMFAALGSRIRVEDLIRGLVVVSGNDAAIILAEGIAGSEFAFADKMTKRARELGLSHLTFHNAWGKDDPDQRVSARDMALLADHVIKTYPDLYKYFSEKDFLWNKIKQPNRNPLLTMDIGADGLKTGYIDEKSGYSIVGSAVNGDGQRLIVTVYGARTAKERGEEARKLLTWGFRSFEAKTLFKAGTVIGTASVYGGMRGDVPLVAKGDVKVLVPRGDSDRLSAKIVYTGPLVAPVAANQQVARLKVTRGNLESLDIPLMTAEAVPVGGLPRRAMDASLELGVGLFRTYVLKK
jgi:D-alanyl-D-alanine carboxypeptidase (penicillin-binding protein 5/6)